MTTDSPAAIKVLIVDDDELALRVMRKLVEAESCQVEVFSSPAKVFPRLEQERFDVILCDMWMGESTGKDFYERIRQDFPQYLKKLIFVTGDLVSESTWDFIDERHVPYILKPFSRPELRRRLTDVVGDRLVEAQKKKEEKPRKEDDTRRRHRRITVKGNVRVRRKKWAVGGPDVCPVINASRNGVLFSSEREYRVGMEMHVAFPYTGYSDIEQDGFVVRVGQPIEGKREVALALGEAAEEARRKFEVSKEDRRSNHIVLETAENRDTSYLPPTLTEGPTPGHSAVTDESVRMAEELTELKAVHDRIIDQRDRMAADEAHIKRQLAELQLAKMQLSTYISDLETQRESLQIKAAEGEEMRFQATHDVLTGLLNRGAIMEFLKKELLRARRENTMVGVILADLDHFKKINDTYGHLAGDTVLREAAQRLQSCVREYDAVGRYGGEEFLIVLSSCTELPVKNAERARATVCAEPVYADEGDITVTVSIGLAGSSTELCEAEQILRAADAALYCAKRSGRNRVEIAGKDDGNVGSVNSAVS
ncbi:MAG: hypothetical protein A3F68_10230 [Acidobacteria bacterium RIFCSPLOWO2_12_FULL_54_10]|nr:MAG: hypothetical protein A3F68_10230 [Acidobacteria bacterium RIFCSPLOWO2_12_FULL_54_10]